jgi:hypothetical protein
VLKPLLVCQWISSISYSLSTERGNMCEFPKCKWSTERVTRPVSLVEQEMLTLPEHMSSPPVFSGIRVAQSLVYCVVFLLFTSFCHGDKFECAYLGVMTSCKSEDPHYNEQKKKDEKTKNDQQNTTQ